MKSYNWQSSNWSDIHSNCSVRFLLIMFYLWFQRHSLSFLFETIFAKKQFKLTPLLYQTKFPIVCLFPFNLSTWKEISARLLKGIFVSSSSLFCYDVLFIITFDLLKSVNMTLQLVEKKLENKKRKKTCKIRWKKNIERHTHNMKCRYKYKLIYRHQIGNKYN